ncbi:phosphate ABC transporter substrate-binding protein (plasmid) [Alteromonas mediterranea]|nr:phosphate ABC transporter substrate-binding protein [Alteromonas mediterranea]APE04169.1 phosphate ABC transporter substrate-binding protein [Alteromonas mediterranea]
MIKKLTSLGALLCLSFTAFADVSVIINKNNANQLDKDEISKIFLGKAQTFPDGNTVIPVNLASSETRSEFDTTVLGRSSSQINAYWSKAIFTGAGNPPKEVASESELLKLVANNPNVIGYVDSSLVDDSVKVINL